METLEVGLCASCVHSRRITSGKGSVFWLCRRSEKEPQYRKYPALPMLACPGYEVAIDPEGERRSS